MTTMAGTRLYAVKSPFSSTILHTARFYYQLNITFILIFLTVFISTNVYVVMLLKFTEDVRFSNVTTDLQSTNNSIVISFRDIELVRECRIAKDIYDKMPNIEVGFVINVCIFTRLEL